MVTRVHPTFWLALGIAAVFGFAREFFMLTAAVTLHEMTHVIMGLVFHARVTEFIITPLGETAVIKGLERKPPGVRAAVILAGPALNLAIGYLGVRVFNVTDFAMPEKGLGPGYFFAANIALGAFNLLPAFPLDGGRFCQMVLGNIIGAARANRLLCGISRFFAVLLIAAGVVQLTLFSYNISLYCIGVYIIKNLPREQLKLSFEFFCYFSPGRGADQRITPIKFFTVTSQSSMEDLIDCLRWDTFSVFNIYFENGGTASFSERDLMRHIKENGLTGRAGELVYEEF
ncbi:MAG: site-2 protease family protein [Clostridiales bacterium]|jgi:stage IV sporulation protein FB|nr:site-2 protease family protein [Clostridiales bacterium]